MTHDSTREEYGGGLDTSRFQLRMLAIIAVAITIAAAIAFLRQPKKESFDYYHRPTGYHWVAKKDPSDGDTVYYGIDPATHWQVYVGPDHVFYTFNHPGAIRGHDLTQKWQPHGLR